MAINVKAKEDYLAQWPVSKRSLIMNQFLRVIREDGADAPDRLLRWLTTAVHKRLASPYITAEDREVQQRLLDSLTTENAWAMAQYCLQWESLTTDEKDAIRKPNIFEYANRAMAAQPPTDKQLKYLKALGCEEIPKTKAEASEWIDALVKK